MSTHSGHRAKIAATLFLGIASAMLTGCEEEGPAERAEAAVDEAVQDTKRAIEDAKD